MKFVIRLILVCLALNLLVSVMSIENNMERKSSSLRHKRHHTRLTRFRKDDDDCGCLIVQSYFKNKALPKKKIYKRRWPLPTPIPTPPQPPVVIPTCKPGDGAALLIELRKIFPPGVQARKPVVKEKVKNSDGSVTTTKSSSTVISGPPTGQFTKQLMDRATTFKATVINDEKNKVGIHHKKHSATGRKLNADERVKLEMEKGRNKFMVVARANCYSKLRFRLEPEYTLPYKGKKCENIGRLLHDCLNL